MKRLLFLILLCSPLLFTSCVEDNYYGSVDTYYVTVGARDWYVPSDSPPFGQPGYRLEAAIPLGAINLDIIDYGAVLVYAVYNDASIQLPDVYADRDGGSDFVQIMGYQIDKGVIYITLEASDYEVKPLSGSQKFKIVVIR